MSHKQAKRARKGIPHLHPQFKREQERLRQEALGQAVVPEKPRAPLRDSTMTRTMTRAQVMALLAGMQMRGLG